MRVHHNARMMFGVILILLGLIVVLVNCENNKKVAEGTENRKRASIDLTESSTVYKFNYTSSLASSSNSDKHNSLLTSATTTTNQQQHPAELLSMLAKSRDKASGSLLAQNSTRSSKPANEKESSPVSGGGQSNKSSRTDNGAAHLAASNAKSVQVDSKTGRTIARMQGKRQADASGLSRRNEDPWFLDQTPYPLQPYRFVYNIKGKNGQTEQYRQEVGDGKFLSGSYGYVLPDGIYRHVDYVADDRGFRAFIRTSEPGTANENPANVVIAANPVITPPGQQTYRTHETAPFSPPPPYPTDYATLRSTLNSHDASELVRRPPGSIINTSLRNFTSFSFTTPAPPSAQQLLGSNFGSPSLFSDTFNLPSRNITTTSGSPGGPLGDNTSNNWLGQTSTGQSGSIGSDGDEPFGRIKGAQQPREAPPGWRQQQRQLNTGNLLPLNYNRLGYLQQGPTLDQPQQVVTTTPAPFSNRQPWTSVGEQTSNAFGDGSGGGRGVSSSPGSGSLNKLTYDKPLSSQGGGGLGSNKLSYDNAHIFHPDLPYLSLERARSLAQLDQMNAAGRGAGLHYIRPNLLGTQVPPTEHFSSHRSSSESSHARSEEHHRRQHETSGPLASRQDGGGEVVVSKEHHSGSKVGSAREFEYHQSTGNRLPPPPPFQHEQQQYLPGGAVKGGGARQLQAPYSGFPTQQKQESPSHETSRLDDLVGGQREISQTTTGSPTSPIPPNPPSSPTSPDEPTTPTRPSEPITSTSPEQQQLERRTGDQSGTKHAHRADEQLDHVGEQHGTKGGGVKGESHRRSPQQADWLSGGASGSGSDSPGVHYHHHSTGSNPPVRAVRMPEDFRASMVMNDLRSMQNTLGLPQPPRLQRGVSSLGPAFERGLSTGSNLADHIVSARMSRADELLSSSRHLVSGATDPPPPSSSRQSANGSGNGSGGGHQQASSVQQTVAVSALGTNEVAVDDRDKQPVSKRKQQSSGQQTEDLATKQLLSTGPVVKVQVGQHPQSGDSINSGLFADGLVSVNETTFDARRLSSANKAARLQAEKVSELEKFQQRLRTQQLLLEQTKSPPEKPGNRSGSAQNSVLANLATTQNKSRPGHHPQSQSSAEMNSHVKYDEEADGTSGSGGGQLDGLVKTQPVVVFKQLGATANDYSRPKRQKELGASSSTATSSDNGGSHHLNVTMSSRRSETEIASDSEPHTTGRRKLTIVQHSLSRANGTMASHSGEPTKLVSDFAQQIQRWPSLFQQSNKTARQQDHTNNGESLNIIEGGARSLAKAMIGNDQLIEKHIDSRIRSDAPPNGAANNTTTAPSTGQTANTINLDFINSVTALSMDNLNPFAIASVNPAVQRSIGSGRDESRLSSHRLDGSGSGSTLEPSLTGGSGGGVATTNARYFNSPELLAALDYHERRDTSAQLKSLLPLTDSKSTATTTTAAAGGWASNHRFMGAASVSAPYMLSTTATPIARSTPIMSEVADTSLRGSFVPKPAEAGSISTQVSSHTRKHRQSVSGESSGVMNRDGFEIRDRALQVDTGRFYEVVSSSPHSFRQPQDVSSSYLAFKDAQLSIPASV